MLRAGDILQNRYEILEAIGSGGMSVVYKAQCHKLNRLVAVKVLKEEFNEDSGFISKFKMEAQAAARLSHPNIVSVYDVVDDGNLHYIVMELIEGITLKNYIAKKGGLEIQETIGIAIQVAQGIAAAHEQHIIHQDIKPQNMIISRDGKVKVADFGIARAVSSQTMNTNAIGSIHYISPEQVRGGLSDERSDIYSFGITMYEMVTGKLPFEGENTVTIALAHLEDPITPPSVYNPDITVSLEKIILKCTQKKKDMRYSSVQEVITDLRKALVHPDEDVTQPVYDASGETRKLTSKELEMIKKGRKPRTPKTEPDDDNPNEKIERLLSGAGIVAAVLIVAVVISLAFKLSGLFRKGTEIPSGAESSVETSEEISLSASQTLMPSLISLSEEDARAKMTEKTLVMNVISKEFSDTIPQGCIMEQEYAENTVLHKDTIVNVKISKGNGLVSLAPYNLVGRLSEEAENLLTSEGFLVNQTEEASENIPAGTVIRYEPEEAAKGAAITLYVSAGPSAATGIVPRLVGEYEDVAVLLMEEAGFVPGEVTLAFSDEYEAGVVISQDVLEGTELGAGSAINYVVSDGPEGSGYHYYAYIDEVFDYSSMIGPGTGYFDLTLEVRVKQEVNGEPVYTTLIPARQVSGKTKLPLSFSMIEGADGVETGELEVVNADTEEVLKSYPLEFFPSN